QHLASGSCSAGTSREGANCSSDLESTLSIVDASDEALAGVPQVLTHGQDQAHDVGARRVGGPGYVIDSCALNVNVANDDGVERNEGALALYSCGIIHHRQAGCAWHDRQVDLRRVQS